MHHHRSVPYQDHLLLKARILTQKQCKAATFYQEYKPKILFHLVHAEYNKVKNFAIPNFILNAGSMTGRR